MGCYAIKFDLKSGYHHLGIFPEHQTYLGFSWPKNGINSYYTFSVLPFGLSTACYIFTKTLRPLVKKWRSMGFRIVLYLDDGIWVHNDPTTLTEHAKIIKFDLHSSGFVINFEKNQFIPSQLITWLGFSMNFVENKIFVTDDKVAHILEKIKNSLSREFSTPRSFSSLVGTLISFLPAMGKEVLFRSRFMQQQIASNAVIGWDRKFSISQSSRSELEFWSSKLIIINGRPIIETNKACSLDVFSDASDFAGGGSYKAI